MAAVLSLAAIVVVVMRARDGTPDVGARLLLGAALLIATPVQPWYALPLVAVATLGGAWWWLAVAAAGYPIYFGVLLSGPHTLSEQVPALAALLVVAMATMIRRMSRRSPGVMPITGSSAASARSSAAT